MLCIPHREAAVLAWALASGVAADLHPAAPRLSKRIQTAISLPAGVSDVRLDESELRALHAILEEDKGVLVNQISLGALHRTVAEQLGRR